MLLNNGRLFYFSDIIVQMYIIDSKHDNHLSLFFFFLSVTVNIKKSKFTPSTFLIHIPDLIVHGSKEKKIS